MTATTFRRLVKELDERFPGLGKQVEDGMAVAIDGVIYQDAYSAPLAEGSRLSDPENCRGLDIWPGWPDLLA